MKNRTVHIIIIIIVAAIVLYGIKYLVYDCSYNPHAQRTAPVHSSKTPIRPTREPHQKSCSSEEEPPFILYYFYSPTCGYCKQFSNAWQEVVDRLSGIDQLELRAVNAIDPENEKLAFYYNISAYPTIILVTPSRNIQYAGDRCADDLCAFVLGIMRKYYDEHKV